MQPDPARPPTPLPVPPLRLVFWELTARCNLRCRHCRRLDAVGPEGRDEFDTPAALAFVDQVAACNGGSALLTAGGAEQAAKPILVISGGEPLLRADLFEIARHGVDQGLTVSLATNGTLVDDDRAARVAACGVARVAVSVDGADARTHDDFRGIPGALEAALAGLRRLRARGLSVQLNCTLTNRNLAQREALYELAVREGADALHFFVLVPVGCGLEIAASHRLTAAQVEDFLNWLAEKAARAPLHLKATCAPQYFRVRRQRGDAPAAGGPPTHAAPGGAGRGPAELQAETRGCLAGSGVCFVSHRGEVFPCGYLPLRAGHLKEQTLRAIWEGSPVFRDFRGTARLEGKCAVCGYQRACFGCRARALGEHGNVWAEDPYCAYVPPGKAVP